MTTVTARRSVRAFGLLALLAGAPTQAQEADAPVAAVDGQPQAKQGLSSVLATLDWGASSSAVLALLEGEIEKRYDEILQTADTLEVDRILRRKNEELKTLRAALVRFDGQRTGFEASVIADDFRPGNGEAMIKVEDGSAQRFFFFKDEQLYKVLVIYSSNVARQLDFSGFVGQIEKKHGPSINREEDAKGALTQATWEDAITRLVAQDRSLFGTYTMAFLDKVRGVQIEADRPARRPALTAVADPAADSMIDDIMQEGGGSDRNVVDSITGAEHNVNLRVGGEEALPLRREADEPVQEKPAKPVRSKKKQPEAPAAEEPKPKGGDVIIY